MRDAVFAAVGLWLIVHEELSPGNGKPILIGAALALCGLPAALRLDELLKKLRQEEDDK